MLDSALHYGKIVFFAAVVPVGIFALILYATFSQY